MEKDLFDDLFDEFPFYDMDKDMQKTGKEAVWHAERKNLMKTDIKDTDRMHMSWMMDLPGFKKDEIKVSLENGYLTISAARGLDVDEQEKDNGTVHPQGALRRMPAREASM